MHGANATNAAIQRSVLTLTGSARLFVAFATVEAGRWKGPHDPGTLSKASTAAQPTMRVKMLAWSALLEIAKNGKKLVPFVPSPS